MGMVVPVNVSDPDFSTREELSDEESEKPADKPSKEKTALEQKLEAETNKLMSLEDQVQEQQVIVIQLKEKISGLPTSEDNSEDHKVDINEKVEDLSYRLTILESKVQNGER